MTAAIVLAAGASSRMGSPKGLLPVGEKTLLETVLGALRKLHVGPIGVVLGAHTEAYLRAVPPHGFQYILHGGWERGRTSSVKAGISFLGEECLGTLIWPVDHPFVRKETILHLLETGSKTSGSWVVPRFQGTRGHPPFLSNRALREVLTYPDEDPLHRYPREHPEEVVEVDVSDPGVLRNIDTPADLTAALESWKPEG
ncbi:MAG: nucleotidyltransferase family protein [Candidatus Thermoplasmatota archaeon]|jgi:CTP:molybdopterin cytidylyltransferase MocA|nr:nucleotidyltransferase family protein [Candidatus Thermoplasmatota archaeon]